MNSEKNTVRLLGASFLLAVIAPLVSYNLRPVVVSDSTIDTMTEVSNHAPAMSASIITDLITAGNVILTGSLLYVILKKQNGTIALVALGVYLIEAAILAVSRIPAFSLLRISQESVIAGHPDFLQALGNLYYESQAFAYDLHFLPWGFGAILFYYLIYKSQYIPRGLALLGMIAAPLTFLATLFILFNYDVSRRSLHGLLLIPNLPYEVGVGLWLIFKGIRDGSETG